MTVTGAVEGIGLGGLVGIISPLAFALVALVLLPGQRAKLVGESLGDAVEDLRTENTALREDRNRFRDERDQARVDLEVTKEELRLCRIQAKKSQARLDELEDPTS